MWFVRREFDLALLISRAVTLPSTFTIEIAPLSMIGSGVFDTCDCHILTFNLWSNRITVKIPVVLEADRLAVVITAALQNTPLACHWAATVGTAIGRTAVLCHFKARLRCLRLFLWFLNHQQLAVDLRNLLTEYSVRVRKLNTLVAWAARLTFRVAYFVIRDALGLYSLRRGVSREKCDSAHCEEANDTQKD